MPEPSSRHEINLPLGTDNFTRLNYRSVLEQLDTLIPFAKELPLNHITDLSPTGSSPTNDFPVGYSWFATSSGGGVVNTPWEHGVGQVHTWRRGSDQPNSTFQIAFSETEPPRQFFRVRVGAHEWGAWKEFASLAQLEAARSMELIGEVVLSATASSIVFSSIPQSYRHLRLIGSDFRSGSLVGARFNGDTGANYHWQRVTANAGNVSAEMQQDASSIRVVNLSSSGAGMLDCIVADYARSDFRKTLISATMREEVTVMTWEQYAGLWSTAAAISSIEIFGVGAFAVGTVVSLYGIKGA